MFKHVIYETEIFKDVKDLDQFLEFLGELFNTKNKKTIIKYEQHADNNYSFSVHYSDHEFSDDRIKEYTEQIREYYKNLQETLAPEYEVSYTLEHSYLIHIKPTNCGVSYFTQIYNDKLSEYVIYLREIKGCIDAFINDVDALDGVTIYLSMSRVLTNKELNSIIKFSVED